jgi:heptosyltransferase-3
MRVLVIQLRRIGDILLTTPVLPYLKKAFPGATIDFLAEKAGRTVLDSNPHVSKLIIYDPAQAWKHIKEIRGTKYDIVFDFLNNPRSSILTGCSGAQWKVGFKRWPRSLFYHPAIPIPVEPEYVPLRKIRLIQEALKRMGKPVPPIDSVRPEIYPNAEDQAFAERWYESEKLSGKPFVVLIPIHRHDIRRWTAEGFKAVGLDIAAKYGCPVYVAWGPGEENILNAVITGHNEELKALPDTTLRQFAAIVKKAKMAITNDSGLMHITVAAGCPTITVYGPTRPIDWNPSLSGWNNGHKDIPVYAGPLGYSDIKDVPPENVIKACDTILKETV